MAKILIVDDDVQTTTLLEEVLSLYGHETTVVNMSSKAIEVANTVNPHVFVLDLMMPEPDGFKLCRMLRADPNFKQTPILIVTALGDTDSRIVASAQEQTTISPSRSKSMTWPQGYKNCSIRQNNPEGFGE